MTRARKTLISDEAQPGANPLKERPDSEQPGRFRVLARDVTGRKRMEDDIRRRELEFRSLAKTCRTISTRILRSGSGLFSFLPKPAGARPFQAIARTPFRVAPAPSKAYIRYGWNYALLLRDGPSERALVPGPLYRCMAAGQIMRFEEITRCPIEIQDTLNPVLPDRILHIPELEGGEKQLLSRQGFNIVATANLRDRGVNEMSAALKRRFKMGLHERLDRMHCRGRRTPLGQAAVACQPRGRTAPLSHVSRTTDLYFAPPEGSLTISNELIQPHR